MRIKSPILVKNISINISQAVTLSIGNPCIVNLLSHGFITGQTVYFSTTGSLPSGLTIGQTYYVIFQDINNFKLATSQLNAFSNAAITTTGSQSGIQTVNTIDPLLISTIDAGLWLNISPDAIIAFDSTLQNLIRQVTNIIENYTWYNLIQKTFISYYDERDFIDNETKLMLDKSPIFNFTDISLIEYFNSNNQWTLFDWGNQIDEGLYENVLIQYENLDYLSIIIRQPLDFSTIPETHKIRITFKSGYNIVQNNNIPEELKTAIKKIVAYNWTNRGDDTKQVHLIDGMPIPADALMIIEQYNRAMVNFAL